MVQVLRQEEGRNAGRKMEMYGKSFLQRSRKDAVLLTPDFSTMRSVPGF